MLTMVMLVCAVPLFSQVAMTAGVRNALNSAPPYDQRITFTLASSQPTTAQIQQAEQSIAQVVNDNLASYTNGTAHFSVQVPALTIASGGTTTAGSNTTRLLSIFSYTLDQIANEITVVQGRLPQAGSDQVEIALTQNTAQSLGVHVGSVISANLPQSVVADDPTGNLDSQTGQSIMMLLRDIVQKTRIGLLVATHDALVNGAADRVVQIQDGVIMSLI